MRRNLHSNYEKDSEKDYHLNAAKVACRGRQSSFSPYFPGSRSSKGSALTCRNLVPQVNACTAISKKEEGEPPPENMRVHKIY